MTCWWTPAYTHATCATRSHTHSHIHTYTSGGPPPFGRELGDSATSCPHLTPMQPSYWTTPNTHKHTHTQRRTNLTLKTAFTPKSSHGGGGVPPSESDAKKWHTSPSLSPPTYSPLSWPFCIHLHYHVTAFSDNSYCKPKVRQLLINQQNLWSCILISLPGIQNVATLQIYPTVVTFHAKQSCFLSFTNQTPA